MAALDDVLAAAPGTGLGGIVVGLFAWVLKMGREDRVDYRAAVKSLAEDHAAQLDKERVRAAEDRAADEAEIDDLRRRLADAMTVADGEREMRREAETKGARLEFQLALATERLSAGKGQP